MVRFRKESFAYVKTSFYEQRAFGPFVLKACVQDALEKYAGRAYCDARWYSAVSCALL